MHSEHLLASCGDDKRLMLWDLRKPAVPTHNQVAHEAEVNCVAFNPYNEFVLITGGGDNTVALWDMRALKKKLHTFTSHQSEVMRVEWAPFCERVFASASNDRRVHVWDAARIGANQSAEDADDGPPELMFIHGGHTSKVVDFSWNTHEAWVMASTAEDNIVQIYAMAESIYADDDKVSEDN